MKANLVVVFLLLIIVPLMVAGCSSRLDGTYTLIYESDTDTPLNSGQIEEAIEVMKHRLDRLDIKGATIQRLGDNRVQLQIPAVKGSITTLTLDQPDHGSELVRKLEGLGIDYLSVYQRRTNAFTYEIRSDTINRAKQEELRAAIEDRLGPIGSFEVTAGISHLVGSSFDVVKVLIGQTARLEFKERTCSELSCTSFEDTDISLSGNDLDSASAAANPVGAGWVVNIQFNSRGTDIFSDLTRRIAGNQTKRIAVFVDEVELLAPVVRAWIRDGRSQLSGSFTQTEARTLAIQLESRSLPSPLHLIVEDILDSQDPMAYNNRALTYHNLGQYQRAVEDYDQAIRLNPQDATAYSNRGAAYRGLGQHERAIEDLDEAIRLNPQLAVAYDNRGNAYLGLGQPGRAIQDHDEAILIDPKYATAYSNRGAAYFGQGQHDRAIQDLDHAIRLDPQLVEAYINRGVAYLNLGQHRQAIQDFNQGIRLDPELAPPYANRALAYTVLGEDEEAQRDVDRAVGLGFDRGILEDLIEELKDQR